MLKVAIIHYWLVAMRGGERVLERILDLYPDADLFTHVYDPAAMSAKINAQNVKTTFIQDLPNARKWYQKYLPLMPMALEGLDLRGYDLVISSESGPSKGVISAPDAAHVCYCHSPMRYLWDHYHDYRTQAGPITRTAMTGIFHYLRSWDGSSARRVDRYVANSHFIRKRIQKAWRRDAEVVYPPVPTRLFRPQNEVEDFYLWVGQMTPYKRADLVVDAFNRLKRPLKMIGTGELSKQIAKRAGDNIEIIPRANFDELRRAYASCRALIMPQEEDFGIIPVEANASGRPVIAFGRGGALETIVQGETGLFFHSQTCDALVDAVERFETIEAGFSPAAAMENAHRFAPEQFDRGFSKIVNEALESAAALETASPNTEIRAALSAAE